MAEETAPTPLSRTWAILKPDIGDIGVVFVFALVVGLLAMATPLAVEQLVTTVAFGRVLQPVVVLSGLLFAFLAFQAAVRLLQVYTIELMQRRIFARAAADLAHRLPRIRHESYDETDVPVLVNQFLDIAGVQKTAATLLLEGSGILLSTLVGMAVLAFYHPWLLGFDLFLLVSLGLVMTVAGIGGVRTAVKESKAKFRALGWFEEMAATPAVFRSTAGYSMGLDRTDALTAEYLRFRSKHFRVLIRQNGLALLLQVVASTVLLGIGGWLVITSRLTLGQLVAAELIVAIIVRSFAKLGKLLESYYDLLASADKVGGLTSLREDWDGTAELPEGPLAVTVTGLAYAFAGRPPALEGFDASIPPGASLGIIGGTGSGKTIVCEMLAGMRTPTHGHIEVDDVSPREVNPFTLRDCVILVADGPLMDGTVLQNIARGNPLVGVREAWKALELVGVDDAVRACADDLKTPVDGHRAPFSVGERTRLNLAAAVAQKPGLLIIDSVLDALPREEAADIVLRLHGPDAPWTLVVATTCEALAESLDAVVRLSCPTRTPAGAARLGAAR